jgi:hypothetical protein
VPGVKLQKEAAINNKEIIKRQRKKLAKKSACLKIKNLDSLKDLYAFVFLIAKSILKIKYEN